MVFPPMPRDIDAAAKPNVLVGKGIVDKVLEGREPSGPADDPAMQSDGHDSRRVRTFFVQRVKAIF